MPLPGASGSDLSELATHLLKQGPNKVLPTPRRVRIIFNQTVIVDTTSPVLVWEHDYYPHYYVPESEIKNATLKDVQPVKGEADATARVAVAELTVAERDGIPAKTTNRVVRFDSSWGDLAGLVRVEFAAADIWLEEDLPIYGHPKDPFKRIDILPSTRPIEVRIAGKTVAKASFANHLHETGLRVRYYLPLGAVDPAILRPSKTTTYCPYKGTAEYYDVVLDGKEYKDVIWYYKSTIHESAAIAGLVSFYNEKVEIYLDGKRVE
ncbi:hypothetical protein TrVFT333_006253 [Trichoderma virens FT-333]|nr:hypothetical protein TrVFT333_006253 [Trichoderma virens FT-333]